MELDAQPYYVHTIPYITDEFNPLTAGLTCAELVRRRIRLKTTPALSLSLPDQTIAHPTDFIPLYLLDNYLCNTRYPNGATFTSFSTGLWLNYDGIMNIMNGFGAAAIDCSTIFHQVNEAVMSISYQGRGVPHVKIWKITTKVYKIDRETEILLLKRYGSVPAGVSQEIGLLGYDSNRSNECVICLEDYIEGSIVVKLPCDHHFHGVCINQWSQIKPRCPLCQTEIPALSSFPFFLWVLDS